MTAHTAPEHEKRAIVTITRPGLELARKLKDGLGATLYVSEKYLDAKGKEPDIVAFDGVVKNLLPRLFQEYDGIVLIMALGIVVRTIAPLIQDKKFDPGIVVVDVTGKFSISLLSGHLGGANQLARDVSDVIGATPVITTGTDVTGTIAPDMIAKELKADLEPFELLKKVSSAIVDGDKVLVINPEKIPVPSLEGPMKPHILLFDAWPEVLPPSRAAVIISSRKARPEIPLPVHVFIRPRVLTVGLGCNRGTSFAEVHTLLTETFSANNLSLSSIRTFGTIDLKSEEEGFLELSRVLDRPLLTFTREELSSVPTPNPSAMVESHVGTPGVAEPAAILALSKNPPFPGGQAHLIVHKTKSVNATIAIAEWQRNPDNDSRQ
ncbi:cobalt-precorrin 5A hydrolase [Leptospirillum ferriphilum]|uniref:Cobalamin biosynthesis protein n=1 Tax=Leptospirillum ferriphilum YSK TaxID=1441628 RepID=A0A059XRW8_9BACT|nr:cobalt-precorrin 5A hydrolase [Leptospirillum ferriphilum]AIA31314.1 cobalamin biosynthesis protein [Leptospirillum ferriphilum YSK]